MESVKPAIDYKTATRLLRDELKLDFDNLKEIDAGQISRTYSLDLRGQPGILQFTEPNMSQGTLNERLFRTRFSEMQIPIRQVLHTGEFLGLQFTVAVKAQGRGLNQLPLDEFMAILPAVMDLLLKIASVDTSENSGYGWLAPYGNGICGSWREHLCQVKEEELGNFYGRWHKLFETTFLDRQVFEHYYRKMEALIDLTPSRRELVHGGFGYGNVLVKDGQVSVVLDWQDARYGDHVFDLAYLLNWYDKPTQEAGLKVYQESIERIGRVEAHLNERIKCYQLYTGIDGLRFAAKTNDEGLYRTLLDKLSQLDDIC
jgi:hygromycin-B 4-O-kinase